MPWCWGFSRYLSCPRAAPSRWRCFPCCSSACAARFVVHYISGITIYKILAPTEIFGTVFDNPALYSLIYNGSYVGIDLVLCLVIFGILYAPLKKYMMGADLRR